MLKLFSNKNHVRNTKKSSILKQKRNILFFSLFLLSSISLLYLIFYQPPNLQIHLMTLSLSILLFFFVALFCFLLSLGSLALRSTKHGILLGLFAVSYLIMRLNSLTHPFFLLLLLGIFLALELLFIGRRKKLNS